MTPPRSTLRALPPRGAPLADRRSRIRGVRVGIRELPSVAEVIHG
jgi:hypothetical protein